MSKEMVVLVFTNLDCSTTPSNILITKKDRDWIEDIDVPAPDAFKQRFVDRFLEDWPESTFDYLTSDEFSWWKDFSDPKKFSFWRANALSENAACFNDYHFFNAGEMLEYVQENDIVTTGTIKVDNYGVLKSTVK